MISARIFLSHYFLRLFFMIGVSAFSAQVGSALTRGGCLPSPGMAAVLGGLLVQFLMKPIGKLYKLEMRPDQILL